MLGVALDALSTLTSTLLKKASPSDFILKPSVELKLLEAISVPLIVIPAIVPIFVSSKFAPTANTPVRFNLAASIMNFLQKMHLLLQQYCI